MDSHPANDENEAGSGSEMEVELEFTEEDRQMAAEIASAKQWLEGLTVTDIINKDVFDDKKVAEFRNEFKQNKPFPFLSIPNFIESEYLMQVLEEVKMMDFREKNNDLYNFSQSNDLKTVTTPLVSKLRDVLYSSDMCKAMADITGIDLFGLDNDSKPDVFAAVYNDTSRLLCHDDELEGRRIAYILYLVPEDWTEEDAGHLDLFNRDPATGMPSSIGQALLPKWASFTFFEVSEASFHQVREVLAKDKNRVSIGGWFHGPPLTRTAHPSEALAPCSPPAALAAIPPNANANAAAMADEEAAPATMAKDAADDEIKFWINKQYRKPAIIRQAANHFQENSSIELKDLLRQDRFEELLKECEDLEKAAFPQPSGLPAVSTFPEDGSGVEFVGPVNLRCYYRTLPEILHAKVGAAAEGGASGSLVVRFQQFMRSPAFYKFLMQLTTCTFSSANVETRMFRPGCYTLSYDSDPENDMEALDVFFSLLPGAATVNWTEEMGGSQHYTLVDEDEELLSCFPSANTLSLVFRAGPEPGAPGVLRFTRYINHHAPSSLFQYVGMYRLAEEEEVVEVKDTKKKKKKVKRT